ncbi:MAG: precorrin-6A reductase, partial [Lachnospiraceae bacterium]|nr:precorrin-6A reductase [Lachnospiraceae bacterium]
MKKIFLFSGTTEGRTLSDMLAEAGIRHIVCVATDYGKDMMEENGYAAIRVGRMDEEQMRHLFMMVEEDQDDANDESPECLVIDATHPYATEVTDNLKRAAKAAGAEYIRVLRNEAKVETKDCKRYEDIASCAKAMSESSGNILLTTGSKELGRYMEIVSKETKDRTYVRVLPSAESLQMCEASGIRPDHIIAMHGPFTKELNEAVMEQYEIRHLITKDGGVSGGFPEKIEAA